MERISKTHKEDGEWERGDVKIKVKFAGYEQLTMSIVR